MREQSLISIIIPVYKTEQYLRACVDSVLAQTYQNLEVILVDDGSPDGSGTICDEYAARDPRVRVIHQENGGSSAARNAGLDAAKGAYIGFVDADDYIEPNMYQALYRRIQETGADIAQCRHRAVAENGSLLAISPDAEDGVLDRKEAIKGLFTGPVQFVDWDKLYSRDILGDIRFDLRYPICEDMLFNYQLLKKSKRIALMRDVYYTYVQYPFSQSNTYSKKYSMPAAARAVIADMDRVLPELTDYPRYTVCAQLVGIYEQAHPLLDRRAKTAPAECEKQRTWSVRELRKELRGILSNPVCPKKLKRKAFLIAVFPHLYPLPLCVWRRMRGIGP